MFRVDGKFVVALGSKCGDKQVGERIARKEMRQRKRANLWEQVTRINKRKGGKLERS